MTDTYIHERPGGDLVEYRRHPDPSLYLQHRVLRKDGHPHDDQWWLVSDSHLLTLQSSGSDIVSILRGW
jgi:hypothetical protein